MPRQRADQLQASQRAVRHRAGAVLARVGPAHPRNLVERCPSLCVGIRDPRLVEQGCGERRSGRSAPPHERARAVRRALVHVGAGGQQAPARPRCVRRARRTGMRKIRQSSAPQTSAPAATSASTTPLLFWAAAHISAVWPFHRSAALTAAPCCQQRLDRRHVPGARGGHQRRLALGQRGVRVGARGEEHVDQLHVAARRREGRAAAHRSGSGLSHRRRVGSAARRSSLRPCTPRRAGRWCHPAWRH